MSDSTDEPFDGQNTLGLLGLLLRCALVIPILALTLVYVFFWSQGHELERAEWKRIIFYVWLGTLIFLTFYALRNRRTGTESRRKEQTRLDLRESQSPADKWEQRSSRRLVREVYMGAVFIPLVGVLFARVLFWLMGISLKHQDYKYLIMVYWLGSLFVALRLALGSRKSFKLLN
jgi:hypothetical protein